ncbi:MAG: 2-dehydropantoate 2-reductase [Tepidisphaerales bacterium]
MDSGEGGVGTGAGGAGRAGAADPHPVVVWVGVGAVGLLYGARLVRAGVHVHLLMRSGAQQARERGLLIRSIDGDFAVRPADGGGFTVHACPDELPAADVVIVSTKTTSNRHLPTLLRRAVRPRTVVLTLQNGMGNEAFLAEAFPEALVCGGTAFVSVHRLDPVTADHQHGGQLHIGRYGGPPDATTDMLAGLLRKTGFPVRVLDDLLRGRWEKQLWNVPFNGLGGALLADTDKLLSTPAGVGLVRGIMREVLAVAAADGRPFPSELIDHKLEYTRGMGPYRTSMQLDREAGREMEVDAIVGSVVRRARELDIRVPLIETLYQALLAVNVRGSE